MDSKTISVGNGSIEFHDGGTYTHFCKNPSGEKITDSTNYETVAIRNRGNGIFEMDVESAENETDSPKLLAEALGAWRATYHMRIITMTFVPSEKYEGAGSLVVVTELPDASGQSEGKDIDVLSPTYPPNCDD